MLWFYEHLEFFVLGLFASGIALHFAVRRLERLRYQVLRDAYEEAIRDSRESDGDPSALVREAELHRAFMSSRMPGWFDGFGGCVVRWVKYCAVFALVAYFFKGPIVWGEEEYAKRLTRAAAAQVNERTAGAEAPERRPRRLSAIADGSAAGTRPPPSHAR